MLRVDDSQAPIFVLRFEQPTAASDYARLMDATDRILERDEPYALLYDGENASVPDPRLIRRLVSWSKSHREKIRRLGIASAFVVMNPLKRGAVRAILALEAVPTEVEVFDSESEALDWLRERVERWPGPRSS